MEKEQKICVSAVIHKEGKILILKRSQKETFLPGYHDFPGGKINFGETPEEGLKREVKEEVNLDVEAQRPISLFSYVSMNDARHTVDIQYLTKVVGSLDGLRLSEAHEDCYWITESEADNYLMSQEMRNVLKKAFEAIKVANGAIEREKNCKCCE